MLRQAYSWGINWIETPYGIWVLFLLIFAELSSFPASSDVWRLHYCVSKPMPVFLLATICTLTAVLGGTLVMTSGY